MPKKTIKNPFKNPNNLRKIGIGLFLLLLTVFYILSIEFLFL